MIGCLLARVRKQPIIALYFEFENELKFYNLEARVTNSLYSDQARHFVEPDLGPNCLQMLSVDDTGRQRVKKTLKRTFVVL